MKILIINQHSKNHGDEAAGLALIRKLYKEGYTNISVSYNMDFPCNDRCKLKYKDIKHITPIRLNRFNYKALVLFNKYPYFLTWILCMCSNELRKEYYHIKNSDIIISASGGVNLGLYHDERYLWKLLITKRLKKKYAIYSPSIGPFGDDKNYLLRVKEVLSSASFLSLRDQKSYLYAEQLHVPFIKSIDTAFLEEHSATKLPEELNPFMFNKFVIIVPNQLYNWHPSFRDIFNIEKIDTFYIQLISIFNNRGFRVVLLPQLYEQGDKNDEIYFKKLKGTNENVTVISTQYSSDIQQKIFEKADFVIGARYHSIIFAINSNTPFCCLSYEHKMSDMLELLDLKEFSIEIKNAFEDNETAYLKILEMFDKKDFLSEKLLTSTPKARKIASDCFTLLCENIL